jgi:Kef-type K+ transport system membrane component KefB
LVGIELDPQHIIKGKALGISLSGILIPFGLGAASSYVIYSTYSPSVPFSSFFIFCGLAMSITAFPVLCRVLASRKLLGTKVGQITLAAAATDDAVAWILLVYSLI